MTDSRGCEHEGTKVETASNRLNGVADPEGATPRWDWLATRAHRHWVESNDVEHVVESFEPLVRSHSRCGDLVLLDAIHFGRGRQNEIEF